MNNNQSVPVQFFARELQKWAQDTVAKRLLPATDYDLMTIQEIIGSGVLESCGVDMAQRHALSISKLNDIERLAKSYCSLLLRGEKLPFLEGLQVHEQMEEQISVNKILLVLLMMLNGVRIEA